MSFGRPGPPLRPLSSAPSFYSIARRTAEPSSPEVAGEGEVVREKTRRIVTSGSPILQDLGEYSRTHGTITFPKVLFEGFTGRP